MDHRSPGGWFWGSVRAVVAISSLLALACPEARGANGDIAGVSGVLSGKKLADITQDTSDGTFWVLGADGSSAEFHRIYHLGSDLSTLLGSIDNPHPSGSIPTNDLTTNRGIAFRPLSKTLFVLASVGPRGAQEFVVREVARDGTPVAGSEFTVASGTGANLHGLSFDSLRLEFWTLDVASGVALRFSIGGTVTSSISVPDPESGGTLVKGRGIFADVEIAGAAVVSRVYVPTGDVFTEGPAKIVQLEPEAVAGPAGVPVGVRTGVEIPVGSVPASDLRGFHSFRIGAGRRVAVVSESGSIYQIQQVISDPLPPGELRCSLTISNQVELTWVNHGAGSNGSYGGGIQVLRNGVPFATVGGDTRSFLDSTPVDGEAEYALRATDGAGSVSAPSCPCRVTVGSGGLVKWTLSPGLSIRDLARDPRNGDIYATDQAGSSILRFSSGLELLGEIPSPWGDPVGIAFIPTITLGFPPTEFTDLLAVTRSSGDQVRIIGLDGAVKTTTNLQFPALGDGVSPEITSLTYDTSAARLVALEARTSRIYTFGGNGSLVSDCRPPAVQTELDFDRGIAYDPLQETFLAAFEDGRIRELFSGGGCPLTGFGFSEASLGDGALEPGFAGGLAIADNTLLVAGMRSNALFQVLIFPFSPEFVRGDADSSGAVEMADAVRVAGYLFQDAPPPSCLDAADVNDDGLLDIADPVYLLFWLFVDRSPPPPAPYPEAGSDPTFRDGLGCGG